MTDQILPSTIVSPSFGSLYSAVVPSPESSGVPTITPALSFEVFNSLLDNMSQTADDAWILESTYTQTHPLSVHCTAMDFGQNSTSKVANNLAVMGSSLASVSAFLDFADLSTPPGPTLSLSTIRTLLSFQPDLPAQDTFEPSRQKLSLSNIFTILDPKPLLPITKCPPFNTALSLSGVTTFLDSEPISPDIMNTTSKIALSLSGVSAISGLAVNTSTLPRIALSVSHVFTIVEFAPLSLSITLELSATALLLPEVHTLKVSRRRPLTVTPHTTDGSRQQSTLRHSKNGKLKKIRKHIPSGDQPHDSSSHAKRLRDDYKVERDSSVISAQFDAKISTASIASQSATDTPMPIEKLVRSLAQEQQGNNVITATTPPSAKGAVGSTHSLRHGDRRNHQYRTSKPPEQRRPAGRLHSGNNSKSGSSAMNAIVIDESPRKTPKREPYDSILLQTTPLGTTTRHRTSPKSATGVLMWSDPKVEEQCITQTTSLFCDIQGEWMKVRQCTGLDGTEAVKNFNELINRVVQKALANEAVDYEDSIRLHDDYANVKRVALNKLKAEGDKELVRGLGELIAGVCDSSHLAELILSHPMADDEHDDDYRPGSDVAGSPDYSKRRRVR
jgi:hypothetical protein